MPDLQNPKHERFCNERMSGMSGAAAYRAAYGDDVRGADQAASRLLRRNDIQARLTELQSETAERNEVTVDSLVADYQHIYDESMKDPKTYAAAVNAKNSIAKITGIWLDKVQVSTESMTDAELAEAIKGEQAGSVIPWAEVLKASRGR